MRRILLQIRMARIKKDTSPQDPCHPLQFQSATGLSDQRLCIISNESPVHSATNERESAAATTAESTADTASAETAGKKLKVALILPGKKDDVSFNQAMYEGMKKYADANPDKIDLNVTENVYEVADIEPALMDFADQGYDVIFGHGFQFMEPIVKVGAQYPDTYFLLGTGYKSLDNTAIYDVELEAGGYEMGVIAALATQTNKIGVIGGADASEIKRGHEGFKAGAKSINPDIEIQEVYTGDWTDTAGAKEAAIGMYDAGVDVIWHSVFVVFRGFLVCK